MVARLNADGVWHIFFTSPSLSFDTEREGQIAVVDDGFVFVYIDGEVFIVPSFCRALNDCRSESFINHLNRVRHIGNVIGKTIGNGQCAVVLQGIAVGRVFRFLGSEVKLASSIGR